MAGYSAIVSKNNNLIRKGLQGSVFLASGTAPLVTAASLFTDPRTLTDGATTAASATLTSASGAFTAADVGAVVSGAGIPANATIVTVVSATSVTLSAPATVTGSAVSVTVTRTGGIKLPTGYKDLGWTTEDGAQFARSVSTNEIKSWGTNSPTRTDITSDVTTVKVTAQETSLQTIGLYTGADTAGIVPSAATGGTVTVAQPAIASPRTYRMLVLAVDSNNAGEFYIARYLPQVKVTDFGDQALNNGDGGIVYPLTFTGYPDSTAGYSQATFYGGPGFTSLSTAMGFPAAV